MPTQTPYGPYFVPGGAGGGVSPSGGTDAGNILAQGLEVLIANQEKDRGFRAMAGQFQALGPEGENLANLMLKDPRAAAQAFEMYGGADKVYQQLQQKKASTGLADAMTNLQAQRTPGGGFDYPEFVRQGLKLGIPLGQLSAATQAIASGNQVNSPDIGQTEDWTEIDGQAYRRRVFFNKRTGGVIQAGDWSPAFRPATQRLTRMNPKTGEMEIYENMTPLQESNVRAEETKGEKGTQNAAEILATLDRAPGASGLSGAVGEFAGGVAAGAANFINNMAGEEIVDPDATEEEISQRMMGASPETRAKYKTAAIQFETSVRQTMDLGKPSDRDMALARDAAAGLSLTRSPRAIAKSVEDLTYLNEKYRWLYENDIGSPQRYKLNTIEGMGAYYQNLIKIGMSPERAKRLTKRLYKDLKEIVPPPPEQ